MNKKIYLILLKIYNVNPEPCKKYIQKLLYMLERKGVNLGLEYRIHYYGPYCADLNDIFYDLKSDGAISIYTKDGSHIISVNEGIWEDDTAAEEQAIIDETLRTYAKKSPKELEILTTTDFVAESLKNKKELTNKNLINFVTEIKGKKFSPDEIKKSVDDLKSAGLLSI